MAIKPGDKVYHRAHDDNGTTPSYFGIVLEDRKLRGSVVARVFWCNGIGAKHGTEQTVDSSYLRPWPTNNLFSRECDS